MWRKTPKGVECDAKYNKKIKGTPGYEAKKHIYIAVRAGRIKPARGLFCVDCGKQAAVYDHRDYSKPLDVEPVCRSCNAKRGPAK